MNSKQQIARIASRIYTDARLLDFKPLTGGISAQTLLLEIMLSDRQTQKVVLRQHGDFDRRLNPNIAKDEYRLLNLLTDAGLPVPRAIYVDDSHTILDVPYLVIEYVEHDVFDEQSIDAHQLRQLAEKLREIHRVNLSKYDLSFLPDQADSLESRLHQPATEKNKHIHQILSNVLPNLKRNGNVLLHGDYWLGNILWRDGNIAAVIDWEDAMLGDPLSDLGKSRLEILWALGSDAMQAYTDAYLAQMPHLDQTSLPFWDLWGAYRLADFAPWFDDKEKVQTMRNQFDWFVNSATRQLS